MATKKKASSKRSSSGSDPKSKRIVRKKMQKTMHEFKHHELKSGRRGKAGNAEEIADEISGTLNELKKNGYVVTFVENKQIEGELTITFGLGEAQQTVKVERYEWKKPGSITKIVIDKLNI